MNRLPRVLVACEFSGRIRSSFERHGWEAWSCDFLPSEIPSLFHYQGDIRDIIHQHWDLMIANPPCTYLVTSGNRWFYHPDDSDFPVEHRRPHPAYPNRRKDQEDAIEFVKFLWGQTHIPHIAIENPMGILPSHIGKYSQVIHPYQFGSDTSKSTALYLKNLPNLTPTRMIPPRIVDGKKRWGNQVDASGADRTPPGPDRWKLRSRTHQGIAEAMAEQWTKYILHRHSTRSESWRDARECSADHYLDLMDSWEESFT